MSDSAFDPTYRLEATGIRGANNQPLYSFRRPPALPVHVDTLMSLRLPSISPISTGLFVLSFLFSYSLAQIGIAAEVSISSPLEYRGFQRSVVTKLPRELSGIEIPSPSRAGKITIQLESPDAQPGGVCYPGVREIPDESTVKSLSRAKDGPGFMRCVGGMVIYRQEGAELALYWMWGSGTISEPFRLRHGDRILYWGGGI